ncbi:SRPBCC family protein [Dactylosporangium matsuzakiense]|uniref:Activator of Hsp90 ATPase homologue 1/2-like C-terminal domain-containing protein n=1 Tax=Dactylosporangium matsuzakiense TaxID=53360 RepID=A0A9W6NTE2_9ACTN|nr:SRPBCC domain-containing protein [Dactylosporangium matsuzakiense]GLL08112.1 hypothetical protein GCM10017581_098720 [Dactylosporangium matsuzakiense]
MTGPAGRATPGYSCRRSVDASRDAVFAAVATTEGLRQWWTGVVSGSAEPGGHLTFGFAGLDEQIVMRVECRRRPDLVTWTCTAHSRGDEWTGSTIRFELTAVEPDACRLDFQHAGIAPELVTAGWEHFLGSLAGYVEHGTGRPYGAPAP